MPQTWERSVATSNDAPRDVTARLELALEWYRGMESERTGRLVYSYDPARDEAESDGSAIRNLASIWDVELLGRFLDRSDLDPLVARSLGYTAGLLVEHQGALVLASDRLGEPSSIAHSAFAMLALAESDVSWRDETIAGLARGILRQQRDDGSYRIYFDARPDDGVELYPGEAMLALVYALPSDARCLASVERGFRWHRERLAARAVARDHRVFYANWQSQYGALLHELTLDDALRSDVARHLFDLHDAIAEDGLYRDLERHPHRQATVEVACALEGLNDAYAIAVRERDAVRTAIYEGAIRSTVAWLFRAQRLEGRTPRECGGFGHSISGGTQRIDVTGHVVSGLIKTARNRIAL